MLHLYATVGVPTEWSVSGGAFSAATREANAAVRPFTDFELTIIIEKDGATWRVPAFWSGDDQWRVRFAAPQPGQYTVREEWSNIERNPQPAGKAVPAARTAGADASAGAILTVEPYTGENPLYTRGAVALTDDRRQFQHADGTPFLWFGDTWWMGFTKRLSWPDGFEELAADRVSKGFTLIQIVAGIYPDMAWADPRGENEAGLPYSEDLSEPNPAWWDLADLKIRSLLRHGLVPCIVGCWGYYSTVFGVEKLKRHWRHIVARWGSYPVVWCLAGEAAMPYYKSKAPQRDKAQQRSDWTEIARYVRDIDPMNRLITIHPTQVGRDQVEDDTVLDFDMLQTGHDGRTAIGESVRRVSESRRKSPAMPVVIGEVIYEGIMHDSDAEKLRLAYWASVLSGAAGFTYGANGIWQLNEEDAPYGPSPHGATWGVTPWREAAQLPGSTQLGLSAQFLARFDYGEMEPHPEWVSPQPAADDYHSSYAAGVADSFRLFYFYALLVPWDATSQPKLVHLEPGSRWTARWLDPRTGAEYDLGTFEAGTDGDWQVPLTPEMKDYVLAITALGQGD